jgi:hypothetical protein
LLGVFSKLRLSSDCAGWWAWSERGFEDMGEAKAPKGVSSPVEGTEREKPVPRGVAGGAGRG